MARRRQSPKAQAASELNFIIFRLRGMGASIQSMQTTLARYGKHVPQLENMRHLAAEAEQSLREERNK